MQWNKLGVCYYPTTVILVDDKKSFLNEVQLALNNTAICKSYSNPKKFLDYIENQHQPDPFINRCLIHDDGQLDHIVYDVDIRTIYREVFNPNRYAQVSVLVVDYSMPNYNGLECCEKTKDELINKILLTGEADTDTAVNAFNHHLINHFIQKNNPELRNVIKEVVSELQMKYFLDLSKKLYGAMPTQVSQCLNDPVFVNFFQQLCEKQQIAEYYLTDSHGSFLLLDRQGKPSWLAVRNEEDMDDILQLADLGEASAEIVDAIKNRQKIPYFHTEADLQTPPSQWDKFMHPAHKLSGTTNYYYAFIADPKAYQLEQQRITSYQDYNLSN